MCGLVCACDAQIQNPVGLTLSSSVFPRLYLNRLELIFLAGGHGVGWSSLPWHSPGFTKFMLAYPVSRE